MNDFEAVEVGNNDLYAILAKLPDGALHTDDVMHRIFGKAESQNDLVQQRLEFYNNAIFGSMLSHTLYINKKFIEESKEKLGGK